MTCDNDSRPLVTDFFNINDAPLHWIVHTHININFLLCVPYRIISDVCVIDQTTVTTSPVISLAKFYAIEFNNKIMGHEGCGSIPYIYVCTVCVYILVKGKSVSPGLARMRTRSSSGPIV